MAQPEPGISGSGKEEETQTTTTTTPREILYKEGSVITDTRYFVWQADEAERQSVCGRGLSMPGKPMARCSGCKVVHYCSKICQKEDWSDRHKEECKLYRDWNSMEHSVETHAHRMFLLALKAVIRLKKEGPDSDFYRLPYDATKLIRPPGSDIITDKPYRTVDPDGVVIKDLDDFSRILGRVTQNWVPGLVDYSLEVTKVGKAVLVPLKTIGWGDTCQANAILAVPPVRPDFKLVSSKPSRIIATRDIYVGEKVVLERFENFGTLAQRQYGHLEMFGRKCVCHMCTDPAEAERNALKCKNSGAPPPSQR
ncbi:hypothetical protein BV898_08779 [Hypsibius exemplaris]|uniref:MYND-type domain-containing protein n=1 Tax=Hypsibius exemplaris TaxID=2072580 RepID=A0A1W0WPC7_HYPEX|nr:hypothetical protein BV898_08779 [Hypsibius exemplaris]